MRSQRALRHAVAASAASAALALAGLGASFIAGPAVSAFADSPTPCHSDTSQPRTYTHGSPITGLVYRHGYYYLDVTPSANCPVDAAGNIHLIGEIHVLAQVSAIGALPGSYPPAGPMSMYWAEFHGTSSSGGEFTLENDPAAVTTPSEPVACTPNSTVVSCLCADGDDAQLTPVSKAYTVVLRYDGPWSAFTKYGSDARFRIAQETPNEVLTDGATLDIVPSASSPIPAAATS